MAARHRQRGMNGGGEQRASTGERLKNSWEQRSSEAASLLTRSITGAGLSASSKWEFNHGKHQREIIRIWCHGMRVCGGFGAALRPVAYRGGERKALPSGGKAAEPRCNPGNPQHCTVSREPQGFPVGFKRS